MKLIHCGDLHLDSKMETGLSAEKARERRLELLRTFTRMLEQAEADKVEAILICGDLFDAEHVSARARNCVLDGIVQHPGITFYYLQGNHDQSSFLSGLEEIPDNLRTFGREWTSYEQGEAVITGAEWSGADADMLAGQLSLPEDRVNLVMFHGMAAEYANKDRSEIFSLRNWRGKQIDYLALGHIHSFRQERLDDRGVWCYCGCLEGRGFDECGLKGYVELEVKAGKVSSRFVPFAWRCLHEVPVDITDLLTAEEIRRRVQEEVQGIPSKDMVKICLTGKSALEAEKDPAWIQKWLEGDYDLLKVRDETTGVIHPEEYQYDVSLKGEFVRLVLGSEELSEEEKEEILRRGIHALEEV